MPGLPPFLRNNPFAFRAAVAGVAALLLAGMLLRSSGTAPLASSGSGSVLTQAVERRSLSVTIRSVGELEAARSTLVTSAVRGEKGKIIHLIEDGARVQEGDLLVRLDPTPFEEELDAQTQRQREAQTALKAAEQALEWEKLQAEREVKMSELDLRGAEIDLEGLLKGEGPLEKSRLDGKMREAEHALQDKERYVAELQRLETRGFANPAELEQAKAALEEARRNFLNAKQEFETFRDFLLPSREEKARATLERARITQENSFKSTSLKIARAAAELQRAQDALAKSSLDLERARRELALCEIKAPLPGLVVLREDYRGGTRRKPRVGDPVIQNQPILFLPDVARMNVRTRVRESDLHLLRAGQEGWVVVDAFPDRPLKASVTSVGVLAESRFEGTTGGEKFFDVELEVLEEDQRLRPGMTVRIEVRAGDEKTAIAVPLHAVFQEEGKHFAYVSRLTGFERREVRLGVQTEDFAEVLEGLAEGDRVALAPPSL